MILNSAVCYDLRYCSTIRQLKTDFESCASVKQSDVIEGNLTSPAEPYTMESITLRLPASQISTTFYFGIKVVDASGQWSKLSNVLPAGVYHLSPPQKVTMEGSTSSTAILIAALTSTAVVLLTGGLVVIIYRKKLQNFRNKYNFA